MAVERFWAVRCFYDISATEFSGTEDGFAYTYDTIRATGADAAEGDAIALLAAERIRLSYGADRKELVNNNWD